jgi:hypothetical protein
MIYQQVIDLLAGVKKTIGLLLTGKDDEHHRLKLQADLDRNITYLSLLTNTPNRHEDEPTRLQPATTIGGKKIVRNQKVVRADLEPNEQRVQVLRQKVESAYSRFLNMEDLFILNEFEENVIRGVAKKAKMRVTKEDPETITLRFIAEIKDNIREQAQRDEKNEKARAADLNAGLSNDDHSEDEGAEEDPDKEFLESVTGTGENVTKVQESEINVQNPEINSAELEIKSNPDAITTAKQNEIEEPASPKKSTDKKADKPTDKKNKADDKIK